MPEVEQKKSEKVPRGMRQPFITFLFSFPSRRFHLSFYLFSLNSGRESQLDLFRQFGVPPGNSERI